MSSSASVTNNLLEHEIHQSMLSGVLWGAEFDGGAANLWFGVPIEISGRNEP